MNDLMKDCLARSAHALRKAAAGLSPAPYTLSGEVKTATSALREAASIGVYTCGNETISGPDKTAILVLAFGTTYAETRARTIEAVEADLRTAFPEMPLFEAYTSHIIIRRVREKESLVKWTPEEAFEHLQAEGFTRVAVVPLNIIPGMEYDYDRIALRQYARHFRRLSLALPLMYYQGTEGRPDQVTEFLQALAPRLPLASSEEAVLLMAHGTPHPANAFYAVIQDRLRELGMSHVYVYSVEGRPDLEDVIPKLRAARIRRVTLLPIMLVAGDHALNDMAGDEPDSHKSRLTAEGFTVRTRLEGLGENPAIRAIYVERAREALAALK